MILPASTRSPPNSLTPRRLPAESRPLREDPPAFLWAMSDSVSTLVLAQHCDEIITDFGHTCDSDHFFLGFAAGLAAGFLAGALAFGFLAGAAFAFAAGFSAAASAVSAFAGFAGLALARASTVGFLPSVRI